ncbi:hypothetical protein OG535_09945 [Kitasatospora sp. NBC_00085]|uniref:hypothetical protein n=1 Tax=unclassified Kitasatospora TaxID=2633591 RepID=UPI00324D0E26
MTNEQDWVSENRTVGVRPVDEVARALTELETSTDAETPTEPGTGSTTPGHRERTAGGCLAGYRWALGRGVAAPVTGAHGDGVPDLTALTAEVDAAMVELDDRSRRTVARDFAQGVHDALAWVCGHADTPP